MDLSAATQLSATLYDAMGWSWTPFIAATFLQEFNHDHSLSVRAQTLVTDGVSVDLAADVVHFHEDTTYWGGRWGLDIATLSGWRFGANGWAGATGDLNDVGGRAYVVLPLDSWHSAAAPPPEPLK